MCLDIKCIDYNNNKICYECSQKNYDEYLKEQIEHGSLVKCDTCGYIWDGNAQCTCYLDDHPFTAFIDLTESDSDETNYTKCEV